MLLSDYKKEFYDYSAKASDILRNASFAGIAVIWIFHVTTNGSFSVPPALILPAALFVLAIISDISQYVIGAIIWGGFHLYQESKLSHPEKDDPQIAHNTYLPLPIWVCFFAKIIFVACGYWLLIKHLFQLLHF